MIVHFTKQPEGVKVLHMKGSYTLRAHEGVLHMMGCYT